jgi:hypothetical protein
MRNGYAGDCVTHACALARLLIGEGQEPWIGRIRDVTPTGRGLYYGPLIPIRFSGPGKPVWNTHYVCCAGPDAFDPIIGKPVPVEQFSSTVFGRNLMVEPFLSAGEVAGLLQEGTLKAAFHPANHGPDLRTPR